MTYAFDGTELTIGGNSFGFDTSKTACEGAAFIGAGDFANNVAQAQFNSEQATALASVLVNHTELPDTSCTTKGTECTACIPSYYVESGVCRKLPYGCSAGSDYQTCTSCISGFQHNADTNTCIGGKNYSDSGTGALLTYLNFMTSPSISIVFPNSSWTVQFYILFVPPTGSAITVIDDVLQLALGTTSLSIVLKYTYAFTPSVNTLTISLKHSLGTLEVASDLLSIPVGEWLQVNLEADQTASTYTLRAKKYGAVTLTGQSHLVPTVMTLASANPQLYQYFKELLVWGSTVEANSQISSHKCQFGHSFDFSPIAQFDFNYNPTSTDLQFVDARGLGSALNDAITGVNTPAHLIKLYQPIAPIGDEFTFSSVSTGPACVRCMPGCQACSDIYTCTKCTSGTLLNGICISATLSPTLGVAPTTSFTMDVQEFTAIKTHILNELRSDPAVSPIQFTSGKLVYPNSRVVTLNSSPFTVPVHEVEGATSFDVDMYLVFTVNGESREGKVATISLTQTAYVTPLATKIQNAQVTPLDSNICGCRVEAECNTETGECTCESGYAGTHCTYTEASLSAFQTQLTSQVTTLESSLSSMTATQVLTELESLSADASAVIDATALKIVSIVSSLVTPTSTEAELTQAASVLSNAIGFAEHSEAGLSIVESIKGVTDQIVSTAITSASALSIASSKLAIKVESIDPATPTAVSPTAELTLNLPAGVIPSGASTIQLSSVVYQSSLYQSAAPSGMNQASSVISLDVYADSVKQVVSGLSENIEMEFTLTSRDSITKNNLEIVANRAQPDSELWCCFFNTATQSASREGCSLISVTSTTVKCGCNHMTDFMAFMRTGLSVLEGSNYDVILAVTQLRPSNLKQNVGFYFALAYWGSFALFCFLVRRVDKAKLKNQFFEKLFLQYMNRGSKMQQIQQEVESLQQEQKQYKSERYLKELEAKSGGLYQSTFMRKRDSASYLTAKTQQEVEHPYINDAIMQARKRNKKFLQEVEVDLNNSKAVDTSVADLRNGGRGSPVIMDNWIEEKEGAAKSGKIQRITERIDSTLEKEKRCCCAFGKLCKSELSSNNQVYNLVSLTSLLNTRPVRLSLFYLAIVLQFALNALFYNLSPSADDDIPLFWEGIIENFWVALYSTLFAMIPLLFMGLVLTVPSKWSKQLEHAQSVQALKQSYQLVEKRLRCKAVTGYVLFGLFSNFFLLYIICFSHVANEQMSQDWARSSSITIVLDLLAFELAPAVIVAFLAVMRGYCRGCRGLLCFIIIIELYRLYRNLIEG